MVELENFIVIDKTKKSVSVNGEVRMELGVNLGWLRRLNYMIVCGVD